MIYNGLLMIIQLVFGFKLGKSLLGVLEDPVNVQLMNSLFHCLFSLLIVIKTHLCTLIPLFPIP